MTRARIYLKPAFRESERGNQIITITKGSYITSRQFDFGIIDFKGENIRLLGPVYSERNHVDFGIIDFEGVICRLWDPL